MALTDSPSRARLPLPEFIALMAAIFGMVAFSMDSFLPALPEIAAELSPDAPNRAQYVLTSFMLGLGIGQFFVGPIADAFGRKVVIIGGLALYAAGAVLSALSPTLEVMVAARILQGLAVSAPRIAGLAMIRDLYAGREMARITSFVMMVFVLMPAAAPLIGQAIMAGFGWHGIFAAFVLLALVNGTWLGLRQPETLAPANRRPLNFARVIEGLREILGNGRVMRIVLMISCTFGILLATLTSIQQIYAQVFDREASFPLFFALTGLVSASGTFINASLVMRIGMRRMARFSYLMVVIITLIALAHFIFGSGTFWAFFIWSSLLFFGHGLTFGNLNALALEPLGHMAGLASSIIGGLSTIAGVLLAAPVGLAFDGSPLPLMLGALVFSGAAGLLMLTLGDAD